MFALNIGGADLIHTVNIIGRASIICRRQTSFKKPWFVRWTNQGFLWCGRQDSNLHALALEPKSNESTNSTTPAYSVDSGEWTADSYCFAVLTMAVSIFSSSLQSL